MSVTHYKRLVMEIDLRRRSIAAPQLPPGYAWASWHPVLAAAHAQVKFESFWGEMDSDVFESLSTHDGCRRLMTEISHHQGFLPVATWLIRFEGSDFAAPTPVATIQGLRKSQWVGSIQNVGVVPAHRGFGLGRALMQKSLLGFHQLGARHVRLNVTAANETAVRLYESLGFRVKSWSYRQVATPVEETQTPTEWVARS